MHKIDKVLLTKDIATLKDMLSKKIHELNNAEYTGQLKIVEMTLNDDGVVIITNKTVPLSFSNKFLIEYFNPKKDWDENQIKVYNSISDNLTDYNFISEQITNMVSLPTSCYNRGKEIIEYIKDDISLKCYFDLYKDITKVIETSDTLRINGFDVIIDSTVTNNELPSDYPNRDDYEYEEDYLVECAEWRRIEKYNTEPDYWADDPVDVRNIVIITPELFLKHHLHETLNKEKLVGLFNEFPELDTWLYKDIVDGLYLNVRE